MTHQIVFNISDKALDAFIAAYDNELQDDIKFLSDEFGLTLKEYLIKRMPSYFENYMDGNFSDNILNMIEYDAEDLKLSLQIAVDQTPTPYTYYEVSWNDSESDETLQFNDELLAEKFAAGLEALGYEVWGVNTVTSRSHLKSEEEVLKYLVEHFSDETALKAKLKKAMDGVN